ncbi:MAG: NBR1-Ig-like domain-containing protein [Chloroflexota bacterium]
MDRHNRMGLILLTLVAVSALACATPLLPSVAQLPTQRPGAMSTYVAGTRGAAVEQTQLFTTPSFTPSLTRTPSKTPTITATPTATIVFNLATLTALAPPVSTKKSSGGGGGGGGGGDDDGGGGGGDKGDNTLTCKVNSTTVKVGGVIVPGDKPNVPPNTAFTVTWNVKNTGKEAWDHKSTDYQYLSGVVFALTDPRHPQLYDFPNTPAFVNPGESIDLSIANPDMISPNKSGAFKATWTLLIGGDTRFCKMSFLIVVP